jgi:hypothetical protein
MRRKGSRQLYGFRRNTYGQKSLLWRPKDFQGFLQLTPLCKQEASLVAVHGRSCAFCSSLIHAILVPHSPLLLRFERRLCMLQVPRSCSRRHFPDAPFLSPSLSASHARVHSTAEAQHPHSLPRRCAWCWLRRARSPLRSQGRRQPHPLLASAMAQHTCLAAGAASLRQTAHPQ